jgi:hypothetical protein
MDQRKRFSVLETMCRERAQIAKKEFEYWLAEADEWAHLVSDNRLAGDSFTAIYAAATFTNKNVGNGKTVLRGGFGIFYDRFGENYTLARDKGLIK